MTMRSRADRTGLTLLEVIISMAIFLASVIAIFQLLILGTERAMDVRLQTRTSMRCESKLAEVIIGAHSLDSGADYTFYDEPDKDLQWKVEATPVEGTEYLYNVKVSVKTVLPTGKIVESHLHQMVVHPSKRGSTFDLPKEPEMMP